MARRPKFGEARGWYEKDPRTGMGGPQPTRPKSVAPYVGEEPSYVAATGGKQATARMERKQAATTKRKTAQKRLKRAEKAKETERKAMVASGRSKRLKRQESPLGTIKKTVEDIVDVVSDSAKEIKSLPATYTAATSKAAEKVYEIPQQKTSTAFGKPTLGTPRVNEIIKAKKQGNLKINQAGKVTTPATRKAAKGLTKAKRIVKSAGGTDLPHLDPEADRVARTVLSTGKRSGATRKELLAAAETGLVESTFHNYAGGDADSEGWRQERTSIYGTGPTGPRNVKAASKRFFEETKAQSGGTAGELAANVQRPAEQYRGRYDEVKPEAAAILNAFEQGGLKPGQRAKVRRLEGNAQRLGIVTGKKGPGGEPAISQARLWGGKKRGKIEGATEGVTAEAASLGRAIAGAVGKPINVISGARPGSTTTSGNTSDHSSGNALDIDALDATEGSVQSEREGNKIAAAAARVSGLGTKTPEFKSFIDNGGVYEGVSPSGYRVQILWKTDIGGNHHNHVHVGIRPEEGAIPSGGSATVGGSTSTAGGTYVSSSQIGTYAKATGQSPEKVGKALLKGSLTVEDIRAKKLRRLKGVRQRFDSRKEDVQELESSDGLDELITKYGSPAV